MARFSIVIPVYNVEKYLNACVESVAGQTFTDFEVLLIDDGATDGSGSLCDAWAAKDSRIRVIHQENQGLSGARNTGIREATGDYLMFLDSDDWWDGPEVLESVARRLEKTRPEVLSLNFRKVWENGRNQIYFASDMALHNVHCCDLELVACNQLWIACAWNKVICRSVFLEHDLLFVPGIVSEDIDWCFRLALYAERFDYLERTCICYRQRAGSLCHTVSVARVEGLYRNVQECLRLGNMAQGQKEVLLRPFVAYQYATLLVGLAELPRKEQDSPLWKDIKALRYLLNWSTNSKVGRLRIANRLLGFRGMLFALRARQVLLRG